jgi:signal transduction histidine kinase
MHPKIIDDPGDLRRRAEKRLREERPESGHSRADANTQRQFHELQVHQIELEMQNEELAEAGDKMEALLEKYTDLYDFAPVGYLTLNPAGEILEANLTGASLLGIARSGLMNRCFGLFVSPADRQVFNAFIGKVFENGGREECEVGLLLEGRPPLDVRLQASVLAPEPKCRVALTDITAHKRAEADLLILKKLESTGILAGGIAHDFNNLLAVIVLNLELAQMRNPPDAELVDYLEMAKKSAIMAGSLTALFVTFAEGSTPIRRTVCLSGLIRESVRPALIGSNVRCEFSLAEELWPTEVDKEQISQVIRVMVLNAREAMPDGGVVFIRAENVVLNDHDQPALPAGEYVRVSIADQGHGIAKDVLPKIFDPYFSTKQRGDQKGMGLGLTICHSVVQKHHGAISVDSEAGHGTTFHICLPAKNEP